MMDALEDDEEAQGRGRDATQIADEQRGIARRTETFQEKLTALQLYLSAVDRRADKPQSPARKPSLFEKAPLRRVQSMKRLTQETARRSGDHAVPPRSGATPHSTPPSPAGGDDESPASGRKLGQFLGGIARGVVASLSSGRGKNASWAASIRVAAVGRRPSGAGMTAAAVAADLARDFDGKSGGGGSALPLLLPSRTSSVGRRGSGGSDLAIVHETAVLDLEPA